VQSAGNSTATNILVGRDSDAANQFVLDSDGQITTGSWHATTIAYDHGGTGLTVYPTRTYTLLAGGAAIGTTAPATRETRELPGTGKQVVDVLNFPYGADAGTGTAWWSFPMPDAYNSGTFVVTVHYFTAVADAGNIIFQLQMSSAGDAENMDVAASTAVELTAPASATANYQRYASFPAHNCAGSPAPGHMIFLKLYRAAGHASDSCTHDAFVQSVKVEFVSNSYSD
jgi:hypothetical protein